MATPRDRYIKFTAEQGKRVVRATRHVERQMGDGTGRPFSPTPQRRLCNPTFQVQVTKDGGFAGANGSADCTWTYTAKNLRGNFTYGTGLTPDLHRLPLTEYLETPAGSIGQGYFDEDGAFALFDANEVPAECTVEELTVIDGGNSAG